MRIHPQQERRFDRAVELGHSADRVFRAECIRLGLAPAKAVIAPLAAIVERQALLEQQQQEVE